MSIFDKLKEEVNVKEIKRYTEEELQKIADDYELELDKIEFNDMIKLNDKLAYQLEQLRDKCSYNTSVELLNMLDEYSIKRFNTASRLRKIAFVNGYDED